MMTVWGKFARERVALPTVTERWTTPDNDFLDLVRLPAEGNAPRLVILHGLEGTPQSHYVGGLFNAAAARGWGADLLIFRGCGDELNRAARSYHSGETSDLDFVVRRLSHAHSSAPIVLAGVSLGGNVLLKWLGESGSALPSAVVAAVGVSVPFDLARSCRHIDSGFSRVYSWNFLRTLKSKALKKIGQHPRLASVDAVERSHSLWSFDDAFTSVAHGFRDAADYYARSSSLQFLSDIRVPTLLISACDDPFYPDGLLDSVRDMVRENPSVVTEFHARGGHVGFVEGTSPRHARYYLDRRVTGFLAQALSSRKPSGSARSVHLTA
jgi:predicted alpha/beta-fold hydrolase